MVTARDARQVYFQVDDAWPAGAGGLETVDVRGEARALRFFTSPARIEAFLAGHQEQFRPFTLFGSGDFHHLSALWLRQFHDQFFLLSFDNHPDWVTSGPKWSCGAWVNRALENPYVGGVSVWGCAGDDCGPRQRARGNRAAAGEGHLAVHPWLQPDTDYPAWLRPITPETWRTELTDWAARQAGAPVYVTVDLDCLTAADAVTNWDPGLFTLDDLVWALGEIHGKMDVIGGDLCGAWSPPAFAGAFQRFASWWDHPKRKIDTSRRADVNAAALQRVWPALSGR